MSFHKRIKNLEIIVSDAAEQIEDLQKIGIEDKFHILEDHYPNLWRMIKKLEEKMEHHEVSLSRKWQANSELSDRLLEVERWVHTLKNNMLTESTFKENVDNLHGRIDEVEGLAKATRDAYNRLCAPSLRREPHKCPVCDGVGINCIIGEIRGLPIKADKCPSCEGKGIVWG